VNTRMTELDLLATSDFFLLEYLTPEVDKHTHQLKSITLIPVVAEVINEKMSVKSTSSESADINQICEIKIKSNLSSENINSDEQCEIGQLKISHSKMFSFGRTKHEITVQLLGSTQGQLHLQLQTAYIEKINEGNSDSPSRAVKSCECKLTKNLKELHCGCRDCCHSWDSHIERMEATMCLHKTLKGPAEFPLTSFGCGFRNQYNDVKSELETEIALVAGQTIKYVYAHNGKKRSRTPFFLIKGMQFPRS
jgi:hypothetical protein